jgi:hypothetical protein
MNSDVIVQASQNGCNIFGKKSAAKNYWSL